MFGESSRLATEVVQFGSSIIKDELSRQMAKVGKAINISRKKGVEVSAPEHFIEGAWRALNADRMDEAFGLMNDSMEELRRMNQLHTEVYDHIAEVRALLQQAEAKNLPVGNAAATLEGAQDLFEEGRYAEARDMSQKAYLEVERGASALIAPKMLGEAESLVDIVGKVTVGQRQARPGPRPGQGAGKGGEASGGHHGGQGREERRPVGGLWPHCSARSTPAAAPSGAPRRRAWTWSRPR